MKLSVPLRIENTMEALIVIAAFVFCAIYLVWFAPSNKFYKQWPAIDDDEFVRRCPPGIDPDVALKIRRILADVSGEDYEHIYPEQRLVDIFELR